MSLTEHWLLHSASDVVGTAKMFALSSVVPLHLIFKVLPLSPLCVLTAEKMLPLLLNRIDCHITLCKPKAR